MADSGPRSRSPRLHTTDPTIPEPHGCLEQLQWPEAWPGPSTASGFVGDGFAEQLPAMTAQPPIVLTDRLNVSEASGDPRLLTCGWALPGPCRAPPLPPRAAGHDRRRHSARRAARVPTCTHPPPPPPACRPCLRPARVLQLQSLGVQQAAITFTNVTMESDKYVCVRETGAQNQLVRRRGTVAEGLACTALACRRPLPRCCCCAVQLQAACWLRVCFRCCCPVTVLPACPARLLPLLPPAAACASTHLAASRRACLPPDHHRHRQPHGA